jgi:hypothetical protein
MIQSTRKCAIVLPVVDSWVDTDWDARQFISISIHSLDIEFLQKLDRIIGKI